MPRAKRKPDFKIGTICRVVECRGQNARLLLGQKVQLLVPLWIRDVGSVYTVERVRVLSGPLMGQTVKLTSACVCYWGQITLSGTQGRASIDLL